MKRFLLMMVTMGCLSMAHAQSNTATQQANGKQRPPMREHMTVAKMNYMMNNQLLLNEKQMKKVAKLNNKYSQLIEGNRPKDGGQRPPMGEGGGPQGGRGGGFGGQHPGGMGPGGPRGGMPPMQQQDQQKLAKQQNAYDQKMRKLLDDKQYEGYLQLKSQFETQRRHQLPPFGEQPQQQQNN